MDKTLQRKEIEIEKSLDDLSRYLDGLFRIPGTGWRFGLDALIGLIPNVGDTLTFVPSMYILFSGVRYGVPKITLLRMALNIAIDYLVGMIPFIGDAFDFVWRSNKKNMELIRTRATGHGRGTRSDYLFIFGLIGGLFLLLIASITASGFILYWVFTSRPLL
ncbi:MAG: DUF4112 domain-containing protein [Acidobacteria bacterium ACB1]|nr:hypothetical protein [Pyrinomonadaceae bacterium]MCE7962312.1 DUF4112 domain-containing protein [Acidobacteria bacterium ACB1]RIJ93243.1 MAG: DUF4112 domain-containing protein [Acidobacteriota bacterium]